VPVIDARTGTIGDRAQGTLAAKVPTGALVTSGLLLATHSLESLFARAASSVQGGLAVEYRVSPGFGFGGGLSYAWQEQDGTGSFTTAMALAQATFYGPRTRF
jgi:hypothetical protein